MHKINGFGKSSGATVKAYAIVRLTCVNEIVFDQIETLETLYEITIRSQAILATRFPIRSIMSRRRFLIVHRHF